MTIYLVRYGNSVEAAYTRKHMAERYIEAQDDPSEYRITETELDEGI